MELPIRFPGPTEVISEEVARFRALSPEGRVQALAEMFRLYQFLKANSGRPAALGRLEEEEEERARIAVQEFVARHG